MYRPKLNGESFKITFETPRKKTSYAIALLQGWIQGWKTDGVIIDASAASMLRGRLRELGGAKRHRGSSGRGNFLEFIKRANYPEKQSGTSWQKIKPYFYGLL